MSEHSENLKHAFQAALETRENAHAPYSKFKVGVAVKAQGVDRLITGCNVENASYGATICAERVALGHWIALHGKGPLEYMVLVTDTDPACGPCGVCLQFMAEFCDPDLPVHLANLSGIQQSVSFKDLLPYVFDSDALE